MGFRVWGFGFGVWGFEFGVWGLGMIGRFRVWALGLSVAVSGLRAFGLLGFGLRGVPC